MTDTIECVMFKTLSQKPKSIKIYKDSVNLNNFKNVNIMFDNYDFNKILKKKYNSNLELLYSLDYEDEIFHFIGTSMRQIEKNGFTPKDNEINKKEFWWENIYDKNYSLICGEVIIIRYNENGQIDNMSVEDYEILENIIIDPQDLYSEDEDSRTSADLESTDEDYIPNEDEDTDDDIETDNEEESDEEYLTLED